MGCGTSQPAATYTAGDAQPEKAAEEAAAPEPAATPNGTPGPAAAAAAPATSEELTEKTPELTSEQLAAAIGNHTEETFNAAIESKTEGKKARRRSHSTVADMPVSDGKTMEQIAAESEREVALAEAVAAAAAADDDDDDDNGE